MWDPFMKREYNKLENMNKVPSIQAIAILVKALSVSYISVQLPVLAEDSAVKESKVQKVEKARPPS